MEPVPTLEAIRTLRSMRRLKTRMIEPEKVRTIIEAAGRAPSGSNTQPWEFIVIKDNDVKIKLRDLTVRGLEVYVKSNLLIPKDTMNSYLTSNDPVVTLAKSTDKIPILILVCLNRKRAKRLTDEWAVLEEQANWASIFPAVQNMLLASRALGIGTAVSIFPLFFEKELIQLFELPNYVKPAILVYLGYPCSRFSEGKRNSIESFVHENRW